VRHSYGTRSAVIRIKLGAITSRLGHDRFGLFRELLALLFVTPFGGCGGCIFCWWQRLDRFLRQIPFARHWRFFARLSAPVLFAPVLEWALWSLHFPTSFMAILWASVKDFFCLPPINFLIKLMCFFVWCTECFSSVFSCRFVNVTICNLHLLLYRS